MKNPELEQMNDNASSLDGIPVVHMVVPESTEKIASIDKNTYDISPQRMAQKAYFCACDYRALINCLYDNLNQPINYAEYLAVFKGVTCEIFLKSLLFHQQTSKVCQKEEGHDLFALYIKLDESTRDKISNSFCYADRSFTKSSFEEALNRNKDPFTTYRYPYELQSMSLESRFITVLYESLFQVCKEIIIDSTPTDGKIVLIPKW